MTASANPSQSSGKSGAQALAKDRSFVSMLHEAGLALELEAAELITISGSLDEERTHARRLDLLLRYYGCGDAATAERRTGSDHLFSHDASTNAHAHQIVARLAALVPELPGLALQRIGGVDGPLVLRAGELVSAIADDDDTEENADTVAVRAVVRALNGLLGRADVAYRFVPLIPDDSRELYVALQEKAAVRLLRSGCLEMLSEIALKDFAGW